MPKVILSEYVEPELADIWDFIALDNLDAADHFLEAAYGTFQELARMPHMGRLRDFPGAGIPDLRSFRIKGFDRYLIFYTPVADGIEVLHILHGARNLEWFWESE